MRDLIVGEMFAGTSQLMPGPTCRLQSSGDGVGAADTRACLSARTGAAALKVGRVVGEKGWLVGPPDRVLAQSLSSISFFYSLF
jgi:hypothetical protein